MRDVAVVAFAQSQHSCTDLGWTEADLVMPLVNQVLAQTGLNRTEIGFTCSGSNDYLVGTPFSFVAALDTIGAWPPISESHVEQDGAWALYEAWVRLQHGDIDTALVYGFGKGTVGDYAEISNFALDPYYLAPLHPGHVGMAGLQARALKDAGFDVDPDPVAPPPADGAAAVILAAGDVARRVCSRPAWIRGLDHRIEPHSPGVRDLTRSESARLAASAAGVDRGPVDVAELHARFEHEEELLRRELGLRPDVVVNPSGGPRKADPIMATGLIRIGEAATRVHDGSARGARSPTPRPDPVFSTTWCASSRQDPKQERSESMGNRCAVIGVGQTKYRAKRTDVSLAGLVREAALAALADAGLTFADIDSVVVGKAPDMFEGVVTPELYLADALGAVGKPMMRVHTAGSVGGSTALVGTSQVQGGVHERVLVVAFEKQSESNATWALSTHSPFGLAGGRRRRLLRPVHPRLHPPVRRACPTSG